MITALVHLIHQRQIGNMIIFMIQEPPPGASFWQPMVYIGSTPYYPGILDLRQNWPMYPAITSTYADLRIVVYTSTRQIIDKRDLYEVFLEEGKIYVYNWRTGTLTGGGSPPEPEPPEPAPPEPEPDLGWKQVTSRYLVLVSGAPSTPVWKEVTSRTLAIAVGQPSVAWKEITSRSLIIFTIPPLEPPDGEEEDRLGWELGAAALGVGALVLIAATRKKQPSRLTK